MIDLTCNFAKRKMTEKEFTEWVFRIYRTLSGVLDVR